jgi:neuronal PAS domain-containing protein 1/3
MAGSSIFDYVHQGDHAEVAEQLGLSLTGHSQGMASPSSSDDGTTHGTMNPDGN